MVCIVVTAPVHISVTTSTINSLYQTHLKPAEAWPKLRYTTEQLSQPHNQIYNTTDK